MSRPYHTTKAEGERTENLLEDFLVRTHGPVTKTPKKSNFDRESEDCWIEIKGRSAKYRSDDKWSEAGWFIGHPKVVAAKGTTKKVVFYYYFSSDKTLWKLDYSDSIFDQLEPKKNFQGQLTYTVPKKFWQCVDFQN